MKHEDDPDWEGMKALLVFSDTNTGERRSKRLSNAGKLSENKILQGFELCKLCDKTLIPGNSMKTHLKEKHGVDKSDENVEKLTAEPEKCDSQKFENPTSESSELSQKQLERQCHYCGYVCGSKSNLKLHLEKHERNPGWEGMNAHNPVIPGERKSKRLSNVGKLPDNKVLEWLEPCKLCDKTFRPGFSMKAHLKEQHGEPMDEDIEKSTAEPQESDSLMTENPSSVITVINNVKREFAADMTLGQFQSEVKEDLANQDSSEKNSETSHSFGEAKFHQYCVQQMRNVCLFEIIRDTFDFQKLNFQKFDLVQGRN